MNKEALLNSNYFIGDIKNPDNFMGINDDSLSYDEDGVIHLTCRQVKTKMMGNYYITYNSTSCLDPTPTLTSFLSGGDSHSPEILFKEFLMTPTTLVDVYNFLFINPLRGNGLQILIFESDETVVDYCHIICQYLAGIFGCDINFIDKMYRPNVKGESFYKGCNQTTAMSNIRRIRDEKLLIEFKSFCAYGADNALSNLTVYLSSFDAAALIYLYNLIFPNEPLPPDNYTTGRLKEIIIGKTIENLPRNNFNNLVVDGYSDFFDYVEEFDE